MTSGAVIERELKLSVWPGFALPDLIGAIDGGTVSPGPDRQLDAVYYDTEDLRLLRRGVTLRFRRGEDPDNAWTAKLPTSAPALGMARREITLAGDPNLIPEPLTDLVSGWAMGAPLVQLARLRTVRRRTTLNNGDGQPLALLDDDEVSIVRGSRVAARFRELEVELTAEAPEPLLPALAERLTDAGAQPVDQVPKLVRALGPRALEPWELAVPDLGSRPTAGALVRAGLVAAAARLADHLAAVVLDEDLEGVHQTRVGIRRLRSDLRTFGSLLDRHVVRPLREELGWLGSELGQVRDLDVLIAGLSAEADRLEAADRPGADELLAQLASDRAAAYVELRVALRSARCASLLAELAEFVAAPPFSSSEAELPAAAVVPALVRRPLRRLRREARGVDQTPDDAELHRLRILAKRLRYATDVAVPVKGKRAREAARTLGELQDVLGDHNDACVALARIREHSHLASPETSWGMGLLGGLQLARAADCRERFPAVFKAALAKRQWAWIA